VVRIGESDRSLSGLTGLAVTDELVGVLGLVPELDRAVGPIKVRERGLGAGQLLVAMATGQLSGQHSLAGLDRVRADAAGALLVHAPVPASTTAAQLARRFGPAQLAGIEPGLSAVYSRWLRVLPAQLRGIESGLVPDRTFRLWRFGILAMGIAHPLIQVPQRTAKVRDLGVSWQ